VIALLLAADVAAADIVVAQRAALDGYQACVSKNAKEFHKTDLSGEDPIIVVYAAAYTCSAERSDLVEKTKQFLRARHPDLPKGSLGKVTAMFIEKQDSAMEQALVAELRK
jgi:hypothetical protein